MNAPRCNELDYIDFLLAAQRAFSCVEAARSGPIVPEEPGTAHDAYTRLLTRRPLDTEALWHEAKTVLPTDWQQGGLILLDDSTLDKPYARKMELVTRHWSGKHRRVVSGINLLSLVWTPGSRLSITSTLNHAPAGFSVTPAVVPCDFRVYEARPDEIKPDETKPDETKPDEAKPDETKPDETKPDEASVHQTKNEHFRQMLLTAKRRGFSPNYVGFDSWYSSLENLKLLRALDYRFITRLKGNRLVNPDKQAQVAVSTLRVPAEGALVHLKGFGMIRLFQTVAQDGDVGHWVTDELTMTTETWQELSSCCWRIEQYHRGLKQCCGVERAQVRSAVGQKNHLLLCLRAFLRLEVNRLRSGQSWYEAKLAVVREAIRAFRAQPRYLLIPAA